MAMNGNKEFGLCKSYLEDLEGIHDLSSDEERELAVRIQNGDSLAKDLLVTHNLKLVIKIAKDFQSRGMELIDLIQEGNIALIKAAETFDVSKGYCFSTYATAVITRRLIIAVRDKSRLVRLPTYMYDYIIKFNQAVSYLENKLSREPKINEIADYLHISIDNAILINNVQLETASLNHTVDDKEEVEEVDLLEDDEKVDKIVISKMMKLDINKILADAKLTEEETVILVRYYGLDGKTAITYEEAGRAFGGSREWARKKAIKALRKIRNNINWDTLCDYELETGKILKKIGNQFFIVEE